ncbi:MAG: protein kinase [Gammaproteobacteria bacterium]|nr:protein kinase [Gammaproteobacteria bacterium]
MKKAINKDNYSQALKTFKQGDYDADMLIHKFDELRSSMEDISEQSLSEIQDLITEAELPAELSEQLFSTITDPKTRIFIPPAETESVATKETSEAHTDSHSSSLLDELLKWSKGDENKEIHVGQTIRGTYRLVSRIGKGGMGEVWKAIDLIQDAGESKDKYVAIKFINHEIRSHPFALKALVREFARYKRLIHPNIVKAYELNRDESEVFIVMEYLEGISLKEFIKQHPDGISLNEAKPIIGGICKALNYAHYEGIIHLDLKPGNVFYDPKTKKAKVIDFGIARLSNKSDRDKTRFDPGSLGAVSTAYASVEMLLDEDPDPRDDIYGLACVAYELISGKHAFNGAMATKAERDKMHPKPVKGLKKAEFQAILKGLSFDRNERTAIAEQFFQDLYLPQLSAKRKRSRWLIIAPILLLAIILTPLLMNKGYDIWKKNQIIEAIAQNQHAGIEKFQPLSIEKQLDLLLNEETLLSLVRFSMTEPFPSDRKDF